MIYMSKLSITPLKNNRLLFHRDLAGLILIVHSSFFVCQKETADGKPGNLFGFGKDQLEVVRAVFFDPHPKSIIFARGITLSPADRS